MIVLDTNVVSAFMRPDMNPIVMAWFDQQARDRLQITVVSLQAIAYGLAMMPEGKRKRTLTTNLTNLEQCDLGSRMLLLTPEAAHRSAIARAAAMKSAGYCGVPDALITGIALTRGVSIATRNISHFQHFGVPLINPWQTA